jgi:hypothetical protein
MGLRRTVLEAAAMEPRITHATLSRLLFAVDQLPTGRTRIPTGHAEEEAGAKQK